MKIHEKIEKINNELLSYSNALKKRIVYDLYLICKEYNIGEISHDNYSGYIDDIVNYINNLSSKKIKISNYVEFINKDEDIEVKEYLKETSKKMLIKEQDIIDCKKKEITRKTLMKLEEICIDYSIAYDKIVAELDLYYSFDFSRTDYFYQKILSKLLNIEEEIKRNKEILIALSEKESEKSYEESKEKSCFLSRILG